MPSSAALIAASVPSKVTLAVPLPARDTRPVVWPSVSVPLVAVSVTRWTAPPPSTSVTWIALPSAVENTCGAPPATCAPGTTFTGAWLRLEYSRAATPDVSAALWPCQATTKLPLPRIAIEGSDWAFAVVALTRNSAPILKPAAS